MVSVTCVQKVTENVYTLYINYSFENLHDRLNIDGDNLCLDIATVFAQKRHRLCTPKTEKRGFTCSTKIRIVQCINKQATYNMCFLKEERSIFDVKKTAPKNNQHKRNNRSLKFDHFCLQNQVTHALDGLRVTLFLWTKQYLIFLIATL